jgi:hypothetical protein
MVESEVRYMHDHGDQSLADINPAVYGRAVVGAVNEVTSWFLETGAVRDPDDVLQQLYRALSI